MAAGDSAKADQIAFHIYTKLFHVLYAARASEQGLSAGGSGKADKWFNLETPLAPAQATPTVELDSYRALSSPHANNQIKPLSVQVLLVVPPPGGGTALVHKASGGRVEPEPRYVLLEEWVLAFATTSTASSTASTASTSTASASASDADSMSGGSRSSSTDDEDAEVLPPTIYKNAIPLFRALFALLRILPAWRVVRKLAGRRPGAAGLAGAGVGAGGAGRRGLRVVVRLRPETALHDDGDWRAGGGGGNGNGGNGNGNGERTLEFGESPSPETGAAPLATSSHVFPGIKHPAAASRFTFTRL
ncbi:autophagy-related protein 13-domain-containing protein [Mycena filopes]|nr:autophagy-related protein 13-domain-containing protein [Mycena filopes]